MSPSAAAYLEILARGAAIGALAVWAIVFAVRPGKRAVGISAVLFCLSGIGFVLNESATMTSALGAVGRPLFILSVAAVGYLWVLTRTLFDDRPMTFAAAMPVIGLTMTGVAAATVWRSAAESLWIVQHGIELIVAFLSLRTIIATWRGDLVEPRRRMRAPALLAIALFAVLWAGLEIGRSHFGWERHDGLVAVGVALVSGPAAAIFLTAYTALVGAPRTPASTASAPAAPPAADPDALLVGAIDRAILIDEIWRREGLTISAFADAIGAPEYRVRRIIHDLKGYRNFTAVVNDARIAAARRMLEDPAQRKRTIAEIAFDLGFGSLGPFNRAFREATNQTPSAYRAQMASKGSSPENLADP